MQTIKMLERATGGKEEVDRLWMSGSAGRALAFDDPSLIWLDHFGERFDFERDPTEYSFFSFICDKGNQFEKKWISEMCPKAVQIMERDTDVRKKEAFLKTLEALDRGEPVLTKAALWWAAEKIYGSADVIAHSDFLFKAFPALKPDKPVPPHYCIIDLKMTSKLDSPAKAASLQAASDQVRIYSYILGHLQGYMPEKAYLFTKDRITDPIVVDVNQTLNKPLSSDLRDRRREYLHIKKDGAKLRPWKDDSVRPNFGNPNSAPWTDAKKEIEVHRIPGRSLTLLPGVGPKLAQGLMDKGYTCLNDLLAHKPESLPLEEVEGIGETLAKRIRAVLKANRSRKPTPFSPEIVVPRFKTELYIDMETMSGLNFDVEKQWPHLDGCEMIFMIGVGWAEGQKWCYKQFVASEESHKGERKMLREFLDFLEQRGALDADTKDVALIHWSPAEPLQAKRAAERQGMKRLNDLPWYDLYATFADTPIGLPKCWDYSLKSIAHAIGEYDERFQIEWPDDMRGLQAMVMGWAAYAQPKPLDTPEMQKLTVYLEKDVRAMSLALKWLRATARATRTAMTEQETRGWYVRVASPYCSPLDAQGGTGWYSASRR